MLRIVGVVVTVLLIAVAVAVVLLKYSILILSDPNYPPTYKDLDI